MIAVGRNPTDKLQLAFDAMMGVKEAMADKTVPRFRGNGLRDAFQEVTGSSDPVDFFDGGC